jgi:hypothetical protein
MKRTIFGLLFVCAVFFSNHASFAQTQFDTSFLVRIDGVDQYLEVELFLFEHSGHSPNWGEPALFYQPVLQVASQK